MGIVMFLFVMELSSHRAVCVALLTGRSRLTTEDQLNVTKSGRTCQRWDSQEPHVHERTAENWPDAGLEENYCCNPDDEDLAWCYTTDTDMRFEFCNVPGCFEGQDILDLPMNNTCNNCTNLECGTVSVKQADYRGRISITNSGRTCESWDTQEPHILRLKSMLMLV
jgi:hypothetical protein